MKRNLFFSLIFFLVIAFVGSSLIVTADDLSSFPDWTRDAVIYQVFVRVFSEEGTLDALTAKIPELEDLGVNTLYLLPVHPTGKVNRKGSLGSPYSIRDYYQIDPRLGTKEDFKELVETAHQHGMRVMMDLVANHTAYDNPLVEEHPDWYNYTGDGGLKNPNAQWTDVVDLNYNNQELREYMIEMAKYWVREFDIDGYRADVSVMVPLDFWQRLRSELKSIKPDFLMLSESAEPFLYKAFDVTYNWDLGNRVQDVAVGLKKAGALVNYFRWESIRNKDGTRIKMNYLENHDHERIASFTHDEDPRPYASFLLTIPGIPLIYNGQEVGMTKRPSLFDDFHINWEEGDQELRKYYNQLIKLRKETPALKYGKLEIVKNGSNGSVISFLRKYNESQLLVIINFSDKRQNIKVSIDNASKDIYYNLLGGEKIKLSKDKEIAIKPYKTIVIKK